MSAPTAAPDTVPRHGLLGGIDPERLAGMFGTPFYAYDLDVVGEQAARLRTVLPAVFDIAYAVKANPSLGIVHHLGSHGLGADVASAGELELALRAGIPADRIVMTGPGKRDVELQAAVRAGIRAITVESFGELQRLAAIAQAQRDRVPILLRSAVPPGDVEAGMRLVGVRGASKFGMDRADLVAAARFAHRSAQLDLLGLHAFGASNVTDADSLADHVAATVALARAIAMECATPLRLVDVGGGLGIGYAPGDPSLDLGRFGSRLASMAGSWADDPVTTGARMLIEPGRFLVGPAGVYVTRVVDRKRIDGSVMIIVDGGIHHLVRPALVGQQHRVCRLGPIEDDRGLTRATERAVIAGPLCSGLDVLAGDALVERLEPGDLVGLLDAGAYGFTESMPFFLSHPMPAEIAVHGGRFSLLRPRLEPNAWLDWQLLPDGAGS